MLGCCGCGTLLVLLLLLWAQQLLQSPCSSSA
jgi:hypothetical protein